MSSLRPSAESNCATLITGVRVPARDRDLAGGAEKIDKQVVAALLEPELFGVGRGESDLALGRAVGVVVDRVLAEPAATL